MVTGEVAERLKAPLSKSGILSKTGSWVRIPPSPPMISDSISPNNIFPDRIKRRGRFDDSLDKLRLPANSGSTLTVLDSVTVHGSKFMVQG